MAPRTLGFRPDTQEILCNPRVDISEEWTLLRVFENAPQPPYRDSGGGVDGWGIATHEDVLMFYPGRTPTVGLLSIYSHFLH